MTKDVSVILYSFNMRKQSICIHLFVIFASLPIFANSTKPEWIQNKPPNTESYYYFVGVGESVSLLDAKIQAEQDTKIQVIDFALGLTIAVNQNIQSSMEHVSLDGNISIRSGLIQIKGLHTESSFVEAVPPNLYRTYLLRKISALNLKQLKETYNLRSGSDISFSEFSIKSAQEDVKVYVNNIYKGNTPIKLFLSKGNYEIRLEKEGFESITKTLLIENTENQSLFVTMDEKVGFVRFVSITPSDAEVMFLNENRFKKDGNVYSLPEGKYQLRVYRQGYIDYVDHIEVLSNKHLNIEIKLKKNSDSSKDIIEIMQTHLEKNELNTIIEISEKYEQKNKTNYRFYVYISTAYHLLGNYKASLRFANKSLNLYKKDLTTRLLICMNEYKIMNYKSAIQTCDESLDHFPSSAELYLWLGRSLREVDLISSSSKNLKLAQYAYQSAVNLNKSYNQELIKFCKELELKNYFIKCDRK